MRCVETAGISGNYRLSGIRDKQIRLRQCLVSSNIFLSAWIYRPTATSGSFCHNGCLLQQVAPTWQESIATVRLRNRTDGNRLVRSHNGRYVSPYETIETLPREKQRCHTGSSSRIYRCMGRMAQFQT